MSRCGSSEIDDPHLATISLYFRIACLDGSQMWIPSRQAISEIASLDGSQMWIPSRQAISEIASLDGSQMWIPSRQAISE